MTVSAGAATFVYVGNAGSNEIFVLSLDPKNGDLTLIEKVAVPGIVRAGGSMPLAVSPDTKFLYAGFRGEPQVAASFAIDPKSGKLKHLGNGPLADSMAYIATDRSGKFLLATSYAGHKVTVNPIDADGVVQAPQQIVPTPPNAHAILADKSNRHVLATSLGGDVVNQFRFDPASGTLSANEPAGTKVKEGAGPRHFRFSANETRVYLLDELDATLRVFPYDANKGVLGEELQAVNILPEGSQARPWAAEVQITPDGNYLYASERTTSTLAGYRIDPKTGMLALVESIATEQQPRSFAIFGGYLYVLGEKSDSMTSYAIDGMTGRLGTLRQYRMGKTPNWIEIVSLA